MDINFSDKHIIITGGAGALGSEVVRQLIDSGAFCSVPCFNQKEWEEFELKDHPHVYTEENIDLANEEQTQSFFADAIEEQGPLWASVHIAGGFAMGKIENTTHDDLMKQINMNLITCFNTCKAAVSYMQEGGGRIVNITARPGLEPRKGGGMIPYTVSKAGGAALTQSLAAEVIDDDILINAIAPSAIDTHANRESMPGADFNKWLKPKEIAHQILYLISEQNTITSGALVPVYGKS
jgi:NAD(P)-dependent dehydrogenase (short-subunit alcohol dehydrogenase family)